MSDLVGFSVTGACLALCLLGAFTKRKALRAAVGIVLGALLVGLFVVALVTKDAGLGIAVAAMTIMSWVFLWAGRRDTGYW